MPLGDLPETRRRVGETERQRMLCNKCGGQNTDDAKACHYCGAKLANKCSLCGHSNPVEIKYCDRCGANLTAKTDLAEHLKNARRHVEKSEFEAAKKECETALAADPENPDAVKLLKMINLALRRLEGLRATAEKALQEKDYAQALAAYNGMLAIFPNDKELEQKIAEISAFVDSGTGQSPTPSKPPEPIPASKQPAPPKPVTASEPLAPPEPVSMPKQSMPVETISLPSFSSTAEEIPLTKNSKPAKPETPKETPPEPETVQRICTDCKSPIPFETGRCSHCHPEMMPQRQPESEEDLGVAFNRQTGLIGLAICALVMIVLYFITGIATASLVVGCIMALGGVILLALTAFRKSLTWGLLCLAVPGAAIVFFFMHRRQTWAFFTVMAVGAILLALPLLSFKSPVLNYNEEIETQIKDKPTEFSVSAGNLNPADFIKNEYYGKVVRISGEIFSHQGEITLPGDQTASYVIELDTSNPTLKVKCFFAPGHMAEVKKYLLQDRIIIKGQWDKIKQYKTDFTYTEVIISGCTILRK